VKRKGILMLKIIILPLCVLIMGGCTPSLEIKEDKKVTIDKEKKQHSKHTKLQKELKKQDRVIKNVKKLKKEKLFQSVNAKEAQLLQKGKNREHCRVCGMNLVKYYKTNHAAKLDGKNVQYCSLHCLTAHIKEGAELENPMVVDVKTLKFIPVTEAFYVVGSDVKGTMSPVSKYAFKSLKDAKAFQKKHGGKILDFYSAWQEAKKDFKK